MSDEDTKKQIDKGTEGDHPWIWQHSNAAAEKFEYITKKKPEPQP